MRLLTTLGAVLAMAAGHDTPCKSECGGVASQHAGASLDPLRHRRMFRFWSRQPIADCTWVGESSPPGDYSGQFARYRYRVSNAGGSTAYGKFQMMPSTYAAFARFGDWSRADQERAAHLLYRAQGSAPWAAC